MYKLKINSFFLSTLVFFFLITSEKMFSEEEQWLVEDIRISGLQRVSAGSIFNVLPIAVGDNVDTYDLQDAAKVVFEDFQIQLISGGDRCTFSESSDFFSYRRDGVNSGRMAHLIWMT